MEKDFGYEWAGGGCGVYSSESFWTEVANNPEIYEAVVRWINYSVCVISFQASMFLSFFSRFLRFIILDIARVSWGVDKNEFVRYSIT